MFSRELDLLIACCRSAYGAADHVERICGGIDWAAFLRLARRHRVQALGWQGLGTAQDLVPPGIAEQFAADGPAIAEANLRAAAECARLREKFDQGGVALLFIKGLTLAAIAYPNPFLKMGWDIDVLVDPASLPSAIGLLRSSGYLPAIPAAADDARLRAWHRTRKESVWHHAGLGIHLELHGRLVDHPSLLPSVGLQSPRQMVRITDQIALPTLRKDELFAYLCVHGASSAWFRLKWITDLAALLRADGPGEIDRLYRRSQELGAGRAAAQALLLAHRLYLTPLGDDLMDKFRLDPINDRLASIAIRQMADDREPTEYFLGTAWIRLSQLALFPGWKFALSEGVRQAKEIVGARLGWN